VTRFAHRLLVLAAAAAASMALAVSPAGADPSWTAAVALPGLTALNTTGVATVDGLSCSSAGNCGLIGTYSDSLRHLEGFVANEVNFVWGSAESIPGLIDLNVGGSVLYPTISCTSATTCTAGGTYKDAQGNGFGFVVDEAGGTWGTAQTLPLSSSLPTGASSEVNQVTCTSPGNCVAAGAYVDVRGLQSLVATEVNGTWAGGIEVPGTGQLNVLALGAAGFVSCPQAGSCTLAGFYADASQNFQTWVDSESGGVWGTAQTVPGLAALNLGGVAAPNSLDCSSVGNCAIGGAYALSSTEAQPFVADEVSGTWQTAEEVPGSLDLNGGSVGAVESVACPADGQCEAVGVYTDNSGGVQLFVDYQVGGAWQDMSELPGTAELNASGNGQLPWVACVSAGDCRSVGGYGDSSNAVQSFDDTQTGGIWQNAEETPGTAALNVEGLGAMEFVSCSSDGGCGAAGVYKDSSGYTQVMVMSTAAPPKPTPPGAPTERVVSKAVGDVTVTITPPSSNGGASITSYQYSVNGGPWKSTGSTTVTIRHLKAKTKVRVRVRAVNSVGAGAASGTATVKVK
jgi:hypothetical protein